MTRPKDVEKTTTSIYFNYVIKYVIKYGVITPLWKKFPRNVPETKIITRTPSNMWDEEPWNNIANLSVLNVCESPPILQWNSNLNSLTEPGSKILKKPTIFFCLFAKRERWNPQIFISDRSSDKVDQKK